MECLLNIRGKCDDGQQARFDPFHQGGLNPLVIPFVGVVGRANEIRLLPLEQEIQAFDEMLRIVLAGHGDDDIGFDDVQRVDIVVHVNREMQVESFEQSGHAPPRPFAEKAHFDVSLREERVSISRLNLIMPTHRLYNCDFKRPSFLGHLCSMENVLLCEG